MANYKIPWNKGKGQSLEEKRAKRKAYYQANRESILANTKKHYKSNAIKIKEYQKWAAITRKYKITKEEFYQLAERQKGLCAICEKKPFTVIDHCHDSGRVRGLLCYGCNRDMAIIDKPEKLERALRYKRAIN